MKLSEILEDADLLAPNSFSIAQKVKWLNQTQRQLYRDYPLWNKVYSFSVTGGKSVYPIPSDCQQDGIEAVVIGQSEYAYAGLVGSTEYRNYSLVDEKLNLYPIPNDSAQGKVYYRPSPVDLTSSDLEAVPSFPEDYHEILSLGIAYRMAARIQDYKLSTEIEARFRNLANEARLNLVAPKPKRITVARRWS